MAEKVIDIDLSAQRVEVRDIDEETLRDYLGGLGLAMKYLSDEVSPDADPLGPENMVVLATGPLAATSAPTNGKTSIVTVSPLNGLLGIGTFGGWWGPRLRFAGFLALRIRGASADPIYLVVDDDRVEIRDASGLWGKDAWETTDQLESELGEDISVLTIGQAGENLVKFACPVSDYYHAAGRSNAGCVLGAKKLKAIAVRGSGKVAVADPAAFKAAVRDATARIVKRAESPDVDKDDITKFYANPLHIAQFRIFGSKNFQTSIVREDSDILKYPESVQDHLVEGPHFGYHCVLEKLWGCRAVADVKEGPYAGTKVGGYCSVAGWGMTCAIRSYPAMWKCQELCQRYGLDVNGIPVAFVMELYQRGVLGQDETDELDLEWGQESATVELIRKTAFREGIGDLMAEGACGMAAVIGKGSEKYALHLKGAEQSPLDPRTNGLNQALGLMVTPRGGDEMHTTRACSPDMVAMMEDTGHLDDQQRLEWIVDTIDMLPSHRARVFGDPPSLEYVDPNDPAGKAALVAWTSTLLAAVNSLGQCVYPATFHWSLGPTQYAQLLSACVGREVSPEQFMKIGERVFNLMRAFICMRGVDRTWDDLPDRFYEEPVADVMDNPVVVSRETMQSLLDELYELMGWDRTGRPTVEKLRECGLDSMAERLAGMSAETVKPDGGTR